MCDDDERQLLLMKNCLEEYFNQQKVEYMLKCFNNVKSVVEYTDKEQADVYFLDIELADGNGVKLAKHLRRQDKKAIIVFITSYVEFMSEAFEVHAYHYLTKPVTDEALCGVLDSIIEYLGYSKSKFFFKFDKETYSINYENIVLFSSERRMNQIISVDGIYAYYGSFQELERQLAGTRFVRIRKNIIINMDYITTVDGNTIYYEIPGKMGEESVVVTIKYRESFFEAFSYYMRKMRML